MERKYKVYKHTFPNGKVYIGMTSQSLKNRCKNGFAYKFNSIMFADIVKYGWNNITHEILAKNLTKQQADVMERFAIKVANATNSDYGYNISPGGSGKGFHFSPETEFKPGVKYNHYEKSNSKVDKNMGV